MKKTNDGTGNIARGTAIIIIAMVIVFGAVFVWMYSMDMLFLPSFIEDLIGKDDNETPWDLGTLSALVKSGKDESGEGVVFEVTYENLRAALLGSERVDGIYFTADVDYYSDGEKHTKYVCYYRDGERFRVELYEVQNGTDASAALLSELKVSDGKDLCVVDKASGESFVLPLGEEMLPENEAGIPSVDALLVVLEDFPSTEGASNTGSSVRNTELKLLRTESGNVYYVAFTYTDIGLVEEYYVSLEHRIVISMTSRQNGELVYSYAVRTVSNTPDDYDSDGLYDISKAAEQ